MSASKPSLFSHNDFQSKLLQASPLAIIVCDKNDRLVDANSQFYEQTQLEAAHVINKLFISLPIEVIDPEKKIMQLFTSVSENQPKFKYWQKNITFDDSPETLTAYYLVMLDQHLSVSTDDPLIKSSRLKNLNVPKRVSWVEFLDYEVSRSRRYDNPLSIIKLHLLVLDSKNSVDQTALRQQVKDTLMDELRWADMIGDTAQGSFLLVLPETDEAAAISLQQKLSQAIQKAFDQNDTEHHCKLVFAHVCWQKNDDSQRLLEKARAQLVSQLEQILAQQPTD